MTLDAAPAPCVRASDSGVTALWLGPVILRMQARGRRAGGTLASQSSHHHPVHATVYTYYIVSDTRVLSMSV